MASQIVFIKPDNIDITKAKAAIDAGLLTCMQIVKADYALFTGTWETENQPEWEEKWRTKQGSRELERSTESNPMVWIDDGTKGPYPIPKSGFAKLAFQEGFVPKTQPRKVMSGPGARFGKMVFAGKVMHPGIKPRNISEEIAERVEYKEDLRFYVQQEMDKVE